MKKTLLAVLIAVIGSAAHAADNECGASYFGGQSPVITNAKLAQRTTPLCFSEFAVMFSGLSRTPLWSAEHLTADRVERAWRLPREDSFHAEPRLPSEDRSELRDFVRSGEDRGHLSPNEDFDTPEAQFESFSLANVIPQNADSNRKLWADIERSVRKLARKRGELYVITGPLFTGGTLQQLNGRVLVPVRLFKLVYDPRSGKGAAYVAANEPGYDYSTMSIAGLERISGISFFPGMSENQKNDPLTLPAPMKYHGAVDDSGVQDYRPRHGNTYREHDDSASMGSLAHAAARLLRY
ncbi:endonuclease (plasmid) [Burkholderia sp. KK1]|uniref:DNA/RNA non-specific endonuclease n=1 Tax=Burkholderia sp. M701 TaxID=326454 RepID=V5YML0_9BURK|nr:DNA/RNA non-specific endonuclease [Burkholderia sp. M701]AQH05553.1 endonuclease [Burkholderia sp. KK1]BAO18820.1 DNA/RNA non-specific endonuclease [Burkholderia sp. M701]